MNFDHKTGFKLKMPNLGDLAAGAGMLGAVFVGLENAFAANLIWAIANPVIILYHHQTRTYNYMCMFIFYELCAVFGVIRHLWGA